MSTPIYLIEFTRGQTTWRFTNYGVARVMNGELYTPENVEVGSVKSGFDFLAESIELTFGTDRTDHPARYYVANPRALERTTITIYRVDAADTAFDPSEPFYVGIASENQPQSNGVVSIRCSSLFRIGEAPVPRPKVQRLCNHRLGDANCKVDLALFTTAGTITGLQANDPPYVEASEFGAIATANNDPNWLALGQVVAGAETRLCVGQAGNRLYLDAAFNFASVGMAISAVAGCDKRMHTCLTKYNNLANNLSFPYVPNQTTIEAALTLAAKNSAGKK